MCTNKVSIYVFPSKLYISSSFRTLEIACSSFLIGRASNQADYDQSVYDQDFPVFLASDRISSRRDFENISSNSREAVETKQQTPKSLVETRHYSVGCALWE